MKEYILLLPILFIFHDMEEIVGFEIFFKKNPEMFERFPKITAPYRNLKTPGFALAVYEEFIPFFGISLLAYFFPGKILDSIWLGLMLSLTAHFLVHVGQALYIRKYIPSLITSVICLPASIFILVKCFSKIEFTLLTALIILVTIPLMMINLKIAHQLMFKFNSWCEKN